MSRMHEYVDVIIGVNDDNDDENESTLLASSYNLHNHYEIIMYELESACIRIGATISTHKHSEM